MAETFFPFDAGAGTAVLEAQWQKMARSWLGTGVIGGRLSELAVSASGGSLSVSVATGQAQVEGFFYENDAAKALTIAAANATNPRIDTVVIRLDRTANTITALVVTGTAAASPVAPTLNATDLLYDLPLANVLVPAAAGVIVGGNVTDRRQYAGPSAPAVIAARAATARPLVVKGAASQSVNLQEWRSSTDTVLLNVASNGTLQASGLELYSASGAAVALAHALFTSTSPTYRPVVVKGAASQTANLLEMQNSSGAVVAGHTASGALVVNTNANAVGSAVAGPNGALPATVAGYLLAFDVTSGTNKRIPYYNS